MEWVCKPSSVRALPRGAIIHLGPWLPTCLCAAYPGIISRRTTSLPLFGLAPDEVYLAVSVAGNAVSSYLAFSPLPWPEDPGGVFSVALSVGSPLLGVTQHPVLWSSDFPHLRPLQSRMARSPDPLQIGYEFGARAPKSTVNPALTAFRHLWFQFPDLFHKLPRREDLGSRRSGTLGHYPGCICRRHSDLSSQTRIAPQFSQKLTWSLRRTLVFC